jgi:hypothetical protein
MRLHFKGRLLASHENIKLGCEWWEMTNALAYNINYTLKSFIVPFVYIPKNSITILSITTFSTKTRGITTHNIKTLRMIKNTTLSTMTLNAVLLCLVSL